MGGVSRFFLNLAGLAALAFFIGFGVFAVSLPRAAAPGPYDGIVVLTGGGGERIASGLSLLEDGQAGRLLISGVFEGTTRSDLAAFGPAGMTRFDCCVDVGRAAENTVGNGRETALWAEEYRLTRVAVVTHAFHMPRALMELRRAAPEVTFLAHPVGGAFTRGVRRTFVEYAKFLVTLTRETLSGSPER